MHVFAVLLNLNPKIAIHTPKSDQCYAGDCNAIKSRKVHPQSQSMSKIPACHNELARKGENTRKHIVNEKYASTTQQTTTQEPVTNDTADLQVRVLAQWFVPVQVFYPTTIAFLLLLGWWCENILNRKIKE